MKRLERLDRVTVQMITTKRMVTGTASVLSGVALLVFGLANFGKLAGESLWLWLAGLAIFLGGGAWQLRDGLRGRRALREGLPSAPR